MCVNINKNNRYNIDLDNVNCNICDILLPITDLDQHIASQSHLRNKDRLITKLGIVDTIESIQDSVIHKWLTSK